MERPIKIYHADHGISMETIERLVEQLNPSGFFIRTVELPPNHPPVESLLYGPLAGDPPITEDEVEYLVRGNRAGPSRMVNRPRRMTRTVTIIGEATPEQVEVYTCYGGLPAPREPWDPSLSSPEEKRESVDFWSTHALAK
jgi:hypothetical protein